MPQVPISIEEYYQPKDDNNLTTASKNIVGAINEINASSGNVPWIVGEYKWMPIGSESLMPVGWVKIDLPDGYTLTSGKVEGQHVGKIRTHRHTIPTDIGEGEMEIFTSVQNRRGGMGLSGFITGIDNIPISQEANIGAGLNAELWQYNPS